MTPSNSAVGDRTIDEDDYGVWKAHCGQSAGNSSGANANSPVPEPATLVLLMLSMAGWIPQRRPKYQHLINA